MGHGAHPRSHLTCGRCIYRKHLGVGAEGYRAGCIAGHEPCGQIVAAGPGLRRFKTADRVILYHISGCGVCNECRRGSMVSCCVDGNATPTRNENAGDALRG